MQSFFITKDKNISKVKEKAEPTESIEQDITQSEEERDDEQSPEPVLGTDAQAIHPERISARVIRVSDGDTIQVDFGEGNIKTVRYIGIDTPETVDPRKSVQCFGGEASNINKSLVLNQTVQLEKDVSETDKYGRLLRYVFLGEMFVNGYLVEEGFAHSSPYPPDIKYQEDLNAMEEDARVANKGLWGSCAGISSFIPKSTSANSADDKDCSDFSTHQDAQDYFNSKAGSSTNNVDKLDGSDRDGQVCETLP